jgi:hypothetical protein
MIINFQEILKELEYRVEHGIIDLTKEEQVTKLVEILRENGISDANEMAQKARVYYSYLNEVDTLVVNKDSGAVYPVKNFNPSKHTKASPKDIQAAKASGKFGKEEPTVKGNSVFGKDKGGDVFGDKTPSTKKGNNGDKKPDTSLSSMIPTGDATKDDFYNAGETLRQMGWTPDDIAKRIGSNLPDIDDEKDIPQIKDSDDKEDWINLYKKSIAMKKAGYSSSEIADKLRANL